MHTLVIFAHPRRDSYTGAVLDSLLAGIVQADHSAEVADLYGEGFESRLQPADYAQFRGEIMPQDVRREQARVERADAIGFVFPVWWWSFPAIMKGWIDRVFCEGWADNFTPGRSRGLLADRPTLLLGVGGSRESTYAKYGYAEAIRIQIDIGILGYCGLRDVTMHLFHGVEEDGELRRRYIARAHEIGRTFLTAGRRQRVPALGSERMG